jgi:hypothetical protein
MELIPKHPTCVGLCDMAKPWYHSIEGYDWFLKIPAQLNCSEYAVAVQRSRVYPCRGLRAYHCVLKSGEFDLGGRRKREARWYLTYVWFNSQTRCHQLALDSGLEEVTNGRLRVSCDYNLPGYLDGAFNAFWPGLPWDYVKEEEGVW